MKRTVLGCLPYLNVRPLIRSIERDVPPGYELIYTVPSNLARRLENGTCDIAAVSSFEALRSPDLVIVPGISIATDGPVTSVMLFSNAPFDQIRRVALDTSSLTGAALTRVILADVYGNAPEFIRADPDPDAMLQQAGACLLIGNNAMTIAPDTPYVLDLGEAWQHLTGLPFVFAVWAARRCAVDERDVRILLDARSAGLKEIDAITAETAPEMGLPESVVRAYLSEIMVYCLGERELAGLSEYLCRCQAHGLLPLGARAELFQPVASLQNSQPSLPSRRPHSQRKKRAGFPRPA